MAFSTVSLGSADILSSSSGTTLKLYSHACFASSEEDVEHALRSLTCAALNSSTGDRIWITKGNEYELMVKLIFDHDVERFSRDECTEAAAAYLQSTKLWKRILLRVTALRQSHEQDGNSFIRLSLDHLDDNADTMRARVHKLADGVPLYDIAIPPGTRIIECESVCLEVRVASSTQSPRLNATHTDDEELLDSLTGSHFAPEAEHRPCEGSVASKRSKTAPAQGCPNFSDGQTHGLKRSYSSDDLQQQTLRPAQLSEFLELFDTAFRLAISPLTKRCSKQVQVTGMESFRHLSEIMPSLWTSGYLAEVSSRAILLPTINHALSNVAVLNPSSRQLRSKFDEVLRRRRLIMHMWSLAQHAMGERKGCVTGAVEQDMFESGGSITDMEIEMGLGTTPPTYQCTNDPTWLDDDLEEILSI